MRFYLVLVLILSGSLAFANTESLCKARVAKSPSSKAKSDEFCKCWARNIVDLSKAEEKLLSQWANGKIDNKGFEKGNYPFAEFVFKVEENCLEDTRYLIQSLKEKNPKEK